MTNSIGKGGGYNYSEKLNNSIDNRCNKTNLSEDEIENLAEDIFIDMQSATQRSLVDGYKRLKKIFENNPNKYMKLVESLLHDITTPNTVLPSRLLILCAPLLHRDCNISVIKKNSLENALRYMFPEILDSYLVEINRQDYEEITIPLTARRLKNWNSSGPVIAACWDDIVRNNNKIPRGIDYSIMRDGDERNAAIKEKIRANIKYSGELRIQLLEEHRARWQSFFPIFPELNQRNNSTSNNNMREPDNNFIHNNQQENVDNSQWNNNSIDTMQIHGINSNIDEIGDPDEKRTEVDFPEETGPVTDPGSDYDSDEEIFFYDDPPLKDKNENKN